MSKFFENMNPKKKKKPQLKEDATNNPNITFGK